MTKKISAVLIFGAPGAGKGTMSETLCSFQDFYHLSSGDVFRALDKVSSLGQEVQNHLNGGTLIPDSLTMKICTKHIDKVIEEKKFDPLKQQLLLDGLPRTLQQAQLLDNIVSVKRVIVLEIKDTQELIRRLKSRFATSQRKDDADENIILQRFEEYQRKTTGVLKHYSTQLTSIIDASQKPIQVLTDLLYNNKNYL